MDHLQKIDIKEKVVALNPLPVEIQTLDPAFLAEYTYTFGAGKNLVTGLDAHGIRHIAAIMNLSITECEIRELPNGTGLLGKATARNLHTGQEYRAHVKQPLKYENGRPVRNAYETCNTRACRNALMGLIPYKIILNALEHADLIKKGEETATTPLGKAKTAARNALYNARGKIKDYGLNNNEIFEQAKVVYGDPQDWNVAMWEQFTKDIRNMKESWINSLIEEKKEKGHDMQFSNIITQK